MRHRKWIEAIQLNRWAETNVAKQRLPVLVRRLVHGTLPWSDLVLADFHGDDENHRPGMDGITKAKLGNAKIPAGTCYWELGADKNPQKKANEDYDKRTKSVGEEVKKESTFIVVTPFDFQKKKDWAQEKNEQKQWKEVRAYDSDDLEQWLEMAPAVARRRH